MTDAAKPGEPPKPEASRLAAVVDGAPLDLEAARALWTEFSAHMDEHRGDMSGFAAKKGWQSVVPEYQRGKAVLLVRTGAPMKAPPPKPPANPSLPRAPKGPPQKKKGPPPQAKKGPPKAQAKKGPPNGGAKNGPAPKQRP